MKNVYFIGIGGIGMSALARYYKFKGFEVAGYDRTPSDLTHALEKEGISVHYEDRPDLVPDDVDETLVVYTPAIPADLGELVKAREGGYALLKRSRTLGEITRGQRCLAVSGTHGKTTTSTLTAHIFTQSGEGCSAFLGGISRNYGTNLLMSRNETVVVEADEFDRSFLQLFPEIAVITAVDADHLDIYGDYAHVVEAFKAFAAQVSGTLIAKKGIPVGPADTPARYLTYHYTDPEADFYAAHPVSDAFGCIHYDLHWPGGVIEDVRVGAPGWVNAENSVAAAAIALTYGLKPEEVKAAIGTFEGVKRRLEVHFNSGKLTYVDDYAHHLLPPFHVPRTQAHGHFPAAPVYPHAGFRRGIRPGAFRRGPAHPPGYLSRPGRAHPRRHLRDDLQGRPGAGESPPQEGGADGLPAGRPAGRAGHLRGRQHRPLHRTHHATRR